MLTCEEYLVPRSLDEAFAAIERNPGRHRIVAGATDTYPWAREGRAGDVHVPVLIDVTKIPELNALAVTERRVRLGAATPMQRFLDDPALARALPCMPRCAVWFADDQIRALATIGGNVVNASPAADGTPCLMAHNAVVEIASRRNGNMATRIMPLHEFVTGPSRTALAPGEILVAFDCEALPDHGGSFEKVGHRRSLVISLVCLAALVRLSPDRRRFEDVRLALAGVAPVPYRLTEVEKFLCGAALTRDRMLQAAEMPVGLVASRTRREYRREVVRGFMLRGLINAVRRAGGEVKDVPELEAEYA